MSANGFHVWFSNSNPSSHGNAVLNEVVTGRPLGRA
jgi:hypothetical protein